MWNGGRALMADLTVLVIAFDTDCYEARDC